MFNVCHLKNAIVKKFMMNECLTDLLQTNKSIDPWTGQPRIQVAESSPATIADSPFIGIDVINTRPLSPDTITHYYRSEVMIIVDSHNSVRTTQIMDAIQHILTVAPEDYDKPYHTYCCDLSDNCVRTRSVRMVERPRVNAAQGSNAYDAETNNWKEMMYVDIVWAPMSCDCEECDETAFNPCPVILPHSPKHPLCQCENLQE